MKSAVLAAALAGVALSLSGAAGAEAQAGALTPPGEGPLDVSADDLDVFDRENRIVYSGDVNAVRGDTRLRADRVEVFFEPAEGAGFGAVTRMEASGDVYYVTPTEVIRGDRGVYDFVAGEIVLSGNVVLTQGCNVSTGSRLVANLETGVSQLAGAEGGERVRSVFFPDRDTQAPAAQVEDCPRPEIPGEGPEPFVEG
ncbi:LPS ABC transporter substrate-binding protein LptA [Marinicauda algicola]|uniref:LPS ABC transporter substrate-binding protein LptA n=1 Tax=Marinicauda algicola TaxID=2029849 RepID=A0A4S2H0Z3_9PROT|nr:LptA/OstA family protein [Marinicauda algicola]TGY88921.1 LPS ABC transporter substrate-binding protein LptA [Marinicauda algicola]